MVNEKSRTYNSILNSLIGILTAIVNIVINFTIRIAIVRALGEEINGLHSLLQNILSILTVFETSICTAMIIHLYQPMKSNDICTLNSILGFYKKIYFALALFIIGMGSIVNIFINKIITTSIPMRDVRCYFVLFIFTVAINYVTYTYRIVLFAAQRNRISSVATMIAELIFRGMAIIMAFTYKSYLLFLLCYVGERVLGNSICKWYARKIYVGLECNITNKSDQLLKEKLVKTVRPLILTRFAEVVQNSSQSILISLLIGNIAIVGYYGNYTLVIGAVGLLYSQLGAAFTSSFGNLSTERDVKRMQQAYNKTAFIMSSMAIIICAGFLACIQDFIKLVFGEPFLLSGKAMVILMFTMFISLINIPIVSVQNATGMHSIDSKNMVIQAIVSVFGGYVGGVYWGIEGLLTGMLIPLIVFTTISKNILISKSVLDMKIKECLGMTGRQVIVGVVVFGITDKITNLIDTMSCLINILLKGVISVVISVGIIYICSFKEKAFKEIMLLIKSR